MAKKNKKATPQVAPAEMPRAKCCVVCDDEYTNRKMGEGSPYEGKHVCTNCLPKVMEEERIAKVKAEEQAAKERAQEEAEQAEAEEAVRAAQGKAVADKKAEKVEEKANADKGVGRRGQRGL